MGGLGHGRSRFLHFLLVIVSLGNVVSLVNIHFMVDKNNLGLTSADDFETVKTP